MGPKIHSAAPAIRYSLVIGSPRSHMTRIGAVQRRRMLRMVSLPDGGAALKSRTMISGLLAMTRSKKRAYPPMTQSLLACPGSIDPLGRTRWLWPCSFSLISS